MATYAFLGCWFFLMAIQKDILPRAGLSRCDNDARLSYRLDTDQLEEHGTRSGKNEDHDCPTLHAQRPGSVCSSCFMRIPLAARASNTIF